MFIFLTGVYMSADSIQKLNDHYVNSTLLLLWT